MKHTTLIYLVLLTASFAGNADAVYKCTTTKGVVYQDRPCREGNETDVQIVIPTGEVAPKVLRYQESGLQGNAPRVESRAPASKGNRTSSDDPGAVTKPADKGTANETPKATSADARKKEPSSSVDNVSVPMTAEQARNTESTAKYYTTDAFSPGSETPEHMTCESPNGEKRRFLLTNGKLTSI